MHVMVMTYISCSFQTRCSIVTFFPIMTCRWHIFNYKLTVISAMETCVMLDSLRWRFFPLTSGLVMTAGAGAASLPQLKYSKTLSCIRLTITQVEFFDCSRKDDLTFCNITNSIAWIAYVYGIPWPLHTRRVFENIYIFWH